MPLRSGSAYVFAILQAHARSKPNAVTSHIILSQNSQILLMLSNIDYEGIVERTQMIQPHSRQSLKVSHMLLCAAAMCGAYRIDKSNSEGAHIRICCPVRPAAKDSVTATDSSRSRYDKLIKSLHGSNQSEPKGLFQDHSM